MKRAYVLLLPLCAALAAADPGSEKTLYQDSIQATKQSIAQETLGVFYRDAVDFYHDQRYDDALQLFNKIYSIDPHYEDVASLRQSIMKMREHHEETETLSEVKVWMHKGNKAEDDGQKVLAVSYWKQALAINPNYEPAQKKILEVNQALAKKEFETGYIHYHHMELDDALEAWSNAIALDPTYKQRGLLLLMSKIELQIHHDQIARLAAQGFDQYQQGFYTDALQTYGELLKLEPRHEEARRMTAKINIQLGQTSLSAAQAAMSAKDYPTAIDQADKTIQYGYEVSRARAIKSDAERAVQVAKQPKPRPVKKPVAVAVSTAPATTTPPVSAIPAQPANPEEALLHYRRGLAAIKNKDYHLAIQELDIASQLDPTNERIYIARERAKQEWTSTNAAEPKS